MKKKITELSNEKFDANGVVIPTANNVAGHVSALHKAVELQKKIHAMLTKKLEEKNGKNS